MYQYRAKHISSDHNSFCSQTVRSHSIVCQRNFSMKQAAGCESILPGMERNQCLTKRFGCFYGLGKRVMAMPMQRCK